MTQKIGNLYICPVINAMGPVIDPKHDDLLGSWDDIDALMQTIFSPEYRHKYPDSAGNPAIFSWFFISWSGFKSNPVQRKMGWFDIYDYYKNRWGEQMAQYGDDLYWMYNHPAASGVGNEWGMDWLHNSHYLEILMRYIDQRDYFPSVVEVVTEKDDTSHFLENYFPYDLGNRNSIDVQWKAKNADGKTMAEVIDWQRATHNWETYSPDKSDYQSKGNMSRQIGRLLDIKSIVYEFKEYEIEKAIHHCLEGHDAMISAYEHDFRHRAEVIQQRFLEPVSRISKDYPQLKWYYQNSLNGFNLMNHRQLGPSVAFSLSQDANNNWLLQADAEIFGNTPFCFFKTDETYCHINPLRVGQHAWLISGALSKGQRQLVVACNTTSGKATIERFDL